MFVKRLLWWGGLLVALVTATLSYLASTPYPMVTPEAVRHGWAGPVAVARAAPLRAAMPRFAIEGAKRDNSRANVRLWRFAVQVNGGRHLPPFRQEIGDCVSMGAANAVNYLQCVQIARDQAANEFHLAFPPYIYGTSRVQVGERALGRSDGSVGAWAATAVRKYGVLAADAAEVPEYSGKIARKWGAAGPPEEFIRLAQPYPVRTTAAVSSAEDVRDAVCNGYPCTVASNWGGLMQPPVIDGRLVNRHAGKWSHQMCIIGYDGETGREPYYYVMNSWGATAHGTPPDDSPPGGFWVRESDVEEMVSEDDSFAFSSFAGFPAQELDFQVIGAP